MVGAGTSEGRRTVWREMEFGRDKASAKDVSGSRENEEKYSGLFCLLSSISASPLSQSSWKPEGKVPWKSQLTMLQSSTG